MRRRKQIWYFDFERIEQGTAPLSPHELEVREQLTHEVEDQLLTKLDLEAAMKTLTPRQQAAFLMFADGHTEAEIASHLKVSQPAVHQLLAKARTHLKKILQGGY